MSMLDEAHIADEINLAFDKAFDFVNHTCSPLVLVMLSGGVLKSNFLGGYRQYTSIENLSNV